MGEGISTDKWRETVNGGTVNRGLTVFGKIYIMRFDLTTPMIDGYQINTVIYTDGSCSEVTKGSGLVSVVTTGPAAKPVVIGTIMKKGVNTPIQGFH